MIPAERMKEITDLLFKKKNVSIKEISEKVFASPSTIRRDLIDLEKAGVLRRTRGGASLISVNTSEFSSYVRSQENMLEKKSIAKKAVEFITNDMSIFMDSSSTIHYICDYLYKYKNLTIITNSILIPNSLMDHDDLRIFCSGGVLKPHSYSLVGDMSNSYLRNYKTDLCFFSVKAINESGIYEADYQQVSIKKTMIENSKKSILLVDSSKFEINAFIKTASLDDIDLIISDKKPNNFNEYNPNIKSKFIFLSENDEN